MIIIVFGLLLSNILYKQKLEEAYSIVEQRNYALNTFIEGYFSEIRNTIEILAADMDILDAYNPYRRMYWIPLGGIC